MLTIKKNAIIIEMETANCPIETLNELKAEIYDLLQNQQHGLVPNNMYIYELLKAMIIEPEVLMKCVG